MAELFPGDDVTLWCAAIDPVLDEHKYIVPGLGMPVIYHSARNSKAQTIRTVSGVFSYTLKF